MDVTPLNLDGLLLIRPRIFRDDRGFFFESYQRPRYAKAGIDLEFVQDNHSRSTRHTLRGLHYQSNPGQAKLVRVTRGRIFDVAVDIRPASPTFGRWHSVELGDENHEQIYLPVGFAHGFCVLSGVAEVLYKTSAPYDPATECTLRFDDPDFGIRWPTGSPLLSSRDQQGESFASFRERIRT